jgi:hypothetical protein
MNDYTYEAVKEVAGAIFYAMLSLYDDEAERESVQILRDVVATDAVQHPDAKAILSSIIRSSRVTGAKAT